MKKCEGEKQNTTQLAKRRKETAAKVGKVAKRQVKIKTDVMYDTLIHLHMVFKSSDPEPYTCNKHASPSTSCLLPMSSVDKCSTGCMTPIFTLYRH